MQTFENYKDSAIWYLNHDSNTMFKAYTREQAHFIIELFFKFAVSDIIVLSGTFPEDVYMKNDALLIKEVIKRFEQISGQIRIITLNGVNEQLDTLVNNSNGIIKYRKASLVNQNIKIPHFMVVDGKRY